MSRAIVTRTAVANAPRTRSVPEDDAFSAAPQVDGYTDRMVKLIPAEVVAFYLFATSSLKSAEAVAAIVPWVVFLFGAVATYFYLRVPLKVTNARQLALTVGAFVVWAFSLGFPFTVFEWYLEAYGGILLAAYTLIAPHVPLDAAA